MAVQTLNTELDERKRRAKRNALLLGLVAVGVYVLFIAMSVFGK